MEKNTNGYRHLDLRAVVAFDDVLPIDSLERSIDAALNVLSAQDTSKQANALAKDGRGAVQAWISKLALAGQWIAMREQWMNQVALAAINAGRPLVESHTTDEGKKVKGWRESSTIATYASMGATIELQHRLASEEHAKLLARLQDEQPELSARELYARVTPNPFRGVEGLGKLYRVATEYAKGQTARNEAAAVQVATVEAERKHAERELAKHAELVQHNPESVAEAYAKQIQAILAKAAADGATVLDSVMSRLDFVAVEAPALTEDEELAQLMAQDAPPVAVEATEEPQRIAA